MITRCDNMILSRFCKEPHSFRNVFSWFRYKRSFWANNPQYFAPDGLTVFIGAQGSGKTLSAVNYVYRLLEAYPSCHLVTNLELRDYPFDGERVFPFFDNDDFARYNNSDKGVIFLVDEIQLYLNSLESKNINLDVVAQLAQQRKQRKHIVCTSQLFGRLAKPLREQFNSIVVCKNLLGFIQINYLILRDSITDMDGSGQTVEGKVGDRFVWFHSPDMYGRYNTYSVISRGRFVSGERQKRGVYDNGPINVSASV